MNNRGKRLDNQNVQDIVSLSPMQAGLLFHYLESEEETNIYFEQLVLNLNGSIDQNLLIKAWDLVVEMNEMLRTVFRWEKLAKPVQIILKKHSVPVLKSDLSELEGEEQEREVQRLIAEDRQNRLDIRYEPCRVTFIKLNNEQCIMVISNHHILFDGWSSGIILQEFLAEYNKLLSGIESSYVQKSSYREYVKKLQMQDQEALQAYWTEYLKDFTSKTNLPLINSEMVKAPVIKNATYHLSRQLTGRINTFAVKHQITPALLVYSVWGIVLQRYCGSDDVVFGTTVSGRNVEIPDIEKMVGLFINTVPFRVKVDSKEAGKEFLQRLNDALQKRTLYENMSLVEIQACSELVGQNLFDTLVVVENYPLDQSLQDACSQLQVESYSISESTNYDLTLVVEITEQISYKFIYNSHTVAFEMIDRMATHLANLFEGLIEVPTGKVIQIPMFSMAEREQILREFNDTVVVYPNEKTLQQLFEEQVITDPTKVAVVFGETQLTYEELDFKANQLAYGLRQRGVRENTLVGVMATKSLEMIIGVMAILKAGGAYLPIDPDYPKERTQYMLKDSGVAILLTSGEYDASELYTGELINISDKKNYIESRNLQSNLSTSQSLAYVIYTSGSTGKPKGVMVEQRNVVRLVKNQNYIQFSAEDKVMQTGTLAFDASTFEVWGALLNGGELHIGTKELVLDPGLMEEYFINHGISIILFTTPLFHTMAEACPQMFKYLRYLVVGGDVLLGKYVNLVRGVCPDVKIINAYGPTENGVISTCYSVEEECCGLIPIGKPINNSMVYIVDIHNNLCPIWSYGELCVSGEGLAQGYLNNPELTQERFVPNPFVPGEQMYRTGDLARWLPDGNIEFLGRVDQQVKIRGFRIELAEVESQLLELLDFKEVVILDHKDLRGSKFLCAYYITDHIFTDEEIKGVLTGRMPDYMIPSYFIQVTEMPKTQNGKIDRGRLPKPEKMADGIYVPPGNQLEEQLALIWSEVLGVDKPGIDDHFFDLGGHSLKATLLASKIHREMNIAVPVRQILTQPTIRELATYIAGSQESIYASIPAVEIREFYQTSSAQKRLYLLQQFEPQSTAYNLPAVLEIRGELDLDLLNKAFTGLIQRHETLRTYFWSREEQVVQSIATTVDFQVDVVESLGQNEVEYDSLITRFVKPFDLNCAPLLRVQLVKLANSKNLLLFDMHHIISDGSSMSILVNDFARLYAREDLRELRIQYKDYAVWQNQFLKSQELKVQENYWLERLNGDIPILNLPTDYLRPPVQSMEGEHYRYTLDYELTERLRKLAKETDSTMYMILLAALNVLLSKYSGQDDIIIGSPIAGRPHADLEQIIGMFVNTLVMRNAPIAENSFLEFLGEVRESALLAYENQDYPFDELVDKLDLPRDLARNPLFDVMFAVQNMDFTELNINGLTFSTYPYENRTAKFDLALIAIDDIEICFNLEYSVKLFKKETMDRLLRHYENILQAISLNPQISLANIEMITNEEKAVIFNDFNDTFAYIPEELTLQELFEVQVAKTPDKLALICEGESLTYTQLNARSNQLARQLRALGVQPNDRIGLLVERSVEMIIGLLGILKSGAAYLPIDPKSPGERIQFMLTDGGVQLLLTQKRFQGYGEAVDKVIFLDEIVQHEVLTQDFSNLEKVNQPTDLAYVIYTSGTTGKPKGVTIEHQNVVNTIVWRKEAYEFDERDVSLVLFSFAFDGFVITLFTPIVSGATIILLSDEDSSDPFAIRDCLHTRKITHFMCVPSLCSSILDVATSADLSSVKSITVGGERASTGLVQNILSLNPEIEVINEYGPTESAIVATQARHLHPDRLITIGKPITNTHVYILDSELRLVPIGVPGEICLSGRGLAKGYLNRLELTAEKFLLNPLIPLLDDDLKAEEHYRRIYRTGDLGRWCVDGQLEFLGRIDQQVKIRGFRIELGEIENVLLSQEDIKEATVIALEDEAGKAELCAYLVPHEGVNSDCSTYREYSTQEWRGYLSTRLPHYMIPNNYIYLPKLPVTPNGKLDHKALPKPEFKSNTVDYVAPQNELQDRLAEIWSSVLGLDKIGIDDHFLDLGGHSLNATLVVAKVHREFDIEVPLREVFQKPTIREFARHIQGIEKNLYTSIPQVEEREFYETSSAQKRLFMIQQFDLRSTAYNLPSALEIRGALDVERLTEVFRKIIRRHETLRTAILTYEDQVVQHISPDVLWNVEYEECLTSTDKFIQTKLQEFIRPFNLNEPPLLRVKVMKLAEERYLLILDMHHIISDGTSMGILIREFASLYKGSDLAELHIQYKDYAAWQNQMLQSKELQQQEEYWLRRFSGEVPVLNIPTDYPRLLVQHMEGQHFSYIFDEELTLGLRELARESKSTMYMVLLAGLNVLLEKYSGQDDIIIGSPIAGRPHADLGNLIGMFVNTLAMRNQPEKEKSFADFLQEVKINSLEAYENQEYQFEELVSKLELSRDLTRNPLFDILFALQNTDLGKIAIEGLEIVPYEVENQAARLDLVLSATEDVKHLKFDVEYNVHLYNVETIKGLLSHLENIFRVVVKTPDILLRDVSLLSVEDVEMIIDRFNQTTVDYQTDITLQRLFENQVAASPEQTALLFKDQKLSYQGLNAKANQLARRLRQMGVQPNELVGIMIERSFEMMIGLFAVLKAGAAYLPIDPKYPIDRKNYMLTDSNVQLLLTQKRLWEKGDITNNQLETLLLDDIGLYRGDDSNLSSINHPEDLAYVIYTSGTTGRPKGVLIEHQNISNTIQWRRDFYKLGVEDTSIQLFSFAFDGFLTTFFTPIVSGARLVILAEEEASDPLVIRDEIKRHAVTHFMCVPSLFLSILEVLTPEIIQSVKSISLGGERLSPELIARLKELKPELEVINEYGPTENTVISTFIRDLKVDSLVTIGEPVANTQIYIMDEAQRLLPIGVPGEICLAGKGLSRGYLNNPELTATKFVDNTILDILDAKGFDRQTFSKIYRTGDLGRWLSNGQVEFLGRIDHQVKIRGYRIELGEIESCILTHQYVTEAVVIDRTDLNNKKFLCAYLVVNSALQDQELIESELTDYLAEMLPDYMIPEHYVLLAELPVTLNGKLDRKALPEPIRSVSTKGEIELPVNEVEESLHSIWCEVLGLERIGMGENFFELGGHSLKATTLVARIHRVMHKEIPLREVFKRPTIREMAEYILHAEQNSYAAIEPIEQSNYYESSSAQKRIYLLQQLDLENTGYNIPAVFEIEGNLEVQRVEDVWKQLIERHESLRTGFEFLGNQVVQKVYYEVEFRIEFCESPIENGNDSRITVLNNFVRPFDLKTPPLFRVAFIKETDAKYTLIFDMHHTISDGTSMGILINDFAELYAGQVLEPLRIQYKDFAAWHQRMMSSDLIRQQESYWVERFSDEIPVLNLPTDYPRPTVKSFEGGSVQFNIDESLTARLKQIERDTDSTLYMLLLSGIAILMAKYSGQEDIIIGSPIAGRPHADLEKIIGVFVNTLAMRNKVQATQTYREFLATVQENSLQGYENQDYQFEILVERLNLQRDLSRNPLFDVMFVLQNTNQGELMIEGLKITQKDYANQTAKFDLTFAASEMNDLITFNLQYCTRLFKAETVEQMAGHLQNIFKSIVDDPERELKDIEMLSEVERQRLIFEYNDTEADYPHDQTLQQIFEAQVAKTPERIALSWQGQHLSYQELNLRANKLARILRSYGVRADQVVGIICERAFEMMVAILGVLKAGGAYLPIAPEYPKERIQFILQDSLAQIVLTYGIAMEGVEYSGTVLDVQDIEANMAGNNPELFNQSRDLAYVLYTSGSTGKPKGVMVEHRSVVNTITHLQRNYPLGETDILLQSTVYTFDAAVREIFWWFFNGARCCLLCHGGEKDPHEIVETIEREKITLVKFVPVQFYEFIQMVESLGIEKVKSLKYILVGGEALSSRYITRFLDVFSSNERPKLVNLYGPSEATLHCTEYQITEPVERMYVPIGRPIANDRVYVLDQMLKPVAIGVPGELFISGVGVAREYLNNPELTEERFILNPFVTGERMYQTGDRVRWLVDGNLEFIERTDHQVKIHGYRIELGEIESLLLQHTGVREAVVIMRKNEANGSEGESYLCAYYVPQQMGIELSVQDLREFLSESLPEYMIPAYIIQLEKLPLTYNGKINRKALPAPENTLTTQREYIPPENAIEIELVRIWQDILEKDQIGVIDNFFELGGQSLKATRLVYEIHRVFNVELSLREVFAKLTIRELAKSISQGQVNFYTMIKPVIKQDHYPASSAQKRLFVQSQFADIGVTYNMPGAVLIEGSLDIARFSDALNALLARHETLRTSFTMFDGQVVQIVHDTVDIPLNLQELELGEEGVVNEHQTQQFQGLLGRSLKIAQPLLQEFIQPFDLSQAPLMRTHLVRISKTQHILFFDLHHIISDGVSMQILIRDLVLLYEGQDLPELRVQYKDFSVWQNMIFASEQIEKQEAYWLDKLGGMGGIPILNIPTDYPRPAVQSFKGNHLEVLVDEGLTKQLRKLTYTTKTTMYMVLLAVFNVLLYKYSGQEDLVVGSPLAGRRHADSEEMIGMFVNMLAIRNNPTGSKTYVEFLHEVRDNTLEAFDNQDYQFEELVEKLKIKRDLSRNPIFDVVFSLQTVVNDSTGIVTEELLIQPLEPESQISKFDLTLEAFDRERQIVLSMEYCTDLFKQSRIERLLTHYLKILEMIAQDPEIQISRIELLSDAERYQLIQEFNSTDRAYPAELTLHQLVALQAEKKPDELALISNAESLSYAELNGRANQLAHQLRNYGVAPDNLVGLMIKRSIYYIIGALGIIKAGGAYVPIDPDYPDERIQYMLDDGQIKLLLTDTDNLLRIAPKVNVDGISFLGKALDITDELLYTGRSDEPENSNKSTDLAYVMYTSGSTGKPKGVMIEHRGVVNLAEFYNQQFDFDQGKRVLHLSNVSFDTSIVEIFPPLIYGSQIFIIDKEVALDKVKFTQFVRQNEIQWAQFVPMTLKELLSEEPKLPSLESIVVGGDKLEDQLKDQILSLGYSLTNHYGPTECTVDALVAVCEKGKTTIGKPLANIRAYILDKDGHLAAIGVPGELCITGVGLARGYLNRSDLTAERFIKNPDLPEERIYRTGDLAVWQDDGMIEFLGRVDQQVKIRGYRIEPGEIELYLQKHESIRDAVVIDRLDSSGIKYLCAYIVTDTEFSILELRSYLSQELPEYMIPSHFMQIEQIPLTYNGKVDRRALPEPENGMITGIEYVAPSTEIEQKLTEIWREILDYEEIGVNHNFFEIGGHSLKATSLLSRIHRELHVQIPLNEVFQNPTIKELARYIASTSEANYDTLEPLALAEHYPVSAAQKRLFIYWQLDQQSTVYNMPTGVILEGNLELHQFRQAIQGLVSRHEALRTSFELVDGEPMQRIHEMVKLEIQEQEVSEEQLEELVAGFRKAFDLTKAPLFRVAIIKFAEKQHLLLFDMPHIISDWLSTSILIQDFAILYRGEELSPLRIQYKDFAAWHNSLLESEKLQLMREYWLEHLKGFVYTKLPTSNIRQKGSLKGKLMELELDVTLTQRMDVFCLKKKITKYSLILAAFNFILKKILNQNDLTIGTLAAGRSREEFENILGIFVNILVIRTQIFGDKTFSEYLMELKDNVLKAHVYQDYPYDDLYAQIKEEVNLPDNSLFSILFNYMPYTGDQNLDLEGIKIKPYTFGEVISKQSLTLLVRENQTTLSLNAIYQDKLEDYLIKNLLQSFPQVLEQVLTNEDILINQLTLGEFEFAYQEPQEDFDEEFDNDDFFGLE